MASAIPGAGNAVTAAKWAKSSFVPGTKVLMADGKKKAIEDVRKGEYVVAGDPETGNLQTRRMITPVSSEGSKLLVRLTVDVDGTKGAARSSTITATANHPFWLPDFGRWAEASGRRLL
ncbi:Hint domain-containing protein [Streptomyces sp. VRA16 Mangrove soil]|uniref:Hint domain-containing protein n=1 Tax=Streptomyces sp. VRA16 Mangrove soil TaxID=2817434 RepID=UPI001A9F46F2|nr:Hint domain-containing protein [Streptomyces sp. VRA16 Mangrove soil]MBO1336298.1 hypothetical protein [Streptomyces sp. VRA16 Mangrove soil]